VGVVLLLAGACTAIVFAGLKKAFIFLFLSVAYITLGLAEEIIFFRSRRQAARDAARETPPASVPQAPREEEVLRELGAFDEAESEGGGEGEGERERYASGVDAGLRSPSSTSTKMP
jgi:hypothetical protein